MFYIILSTIENEQERLKIADIYENYRYKCLYVALNITKNHELAEDAVEDTFIEIIKQKDKILSLSCSDLLPYIVTIVKSRAINIMKKYNKFSDIPIDDFAKNMKSGETPVDEQIIDKQGFEYLINQIANLDENYKIVFEMKYLHNMSNGEIAKILDITKKNVEIRLYRAKQKLRNLIEKEVKIDA